MRRQNIHYFCLPVFFCCTFMVIPMVANAQVNMSWLDKVDTYAEKLIKHKKSEKKTASLALLKEEDLIIKEEGLSYAMAKNQLEDEKSRAFRDKIVGGQRESRFSITAYKLKDGTFIIQETNSTAPEALVEIPKKYDGISNNWSNGLAVVSKDGKYGFINIYGEEVIPLKYDRADRFRQLRANVVYNGKQGVIDTKGNHIAGFEEVNETPDSNFKIVKKEGKYGVVNKKGEVLIPYKYDFLGSEINDTLLRARLNGKYGFVSMRGEIIVPFQFDGARNFDDGMAKVMIEEAGESKWGVVNAGGKMVIPTAYRKSGDISIFPEADLIALKKEEKWGFSDYSGKEIIPPVYAGIYASATNGWMKVKMRKVTEKGYAYYRYGMIDKKGEVVIPAKYLELGDFQEGLARVQILKGNVPLFGYIDMHDNLVIPPQFGHAQDFQNGSAPVEINGKWGLIDTKGQILIPPLFTSITSFNESGIAGVGFKENFFNINKKGECVKNCP